MNMQSGFAMETDGLPMPGRIWAVVAISFGTSLLTIDGMIANVALPTIADDLGVGGGVITSVVTVYQLVLVMLLLPFANAGDRIGHRNLYQIGQVVFLFSSLAVLFATNLVTLLVVRAMQAFGAGMALSVSAAMLREIYPARQLGSGMGINSVIVASSASLAPTLGGYIVAHAHWHWVFLAAVPMAGISLLMGRFLPKPIKHDRKHEWISSAWSALTMLLLIGGLQLATQATDPLPGTALLAMGAASGVFLVRRERRRSNPVVPVDLMATPAIGLSALGALCAFIAAGSLMLALPFRLQGVLGYTPDEVGLLLLPFPATMLIVAPAAGWLSDRIAPAKLGITGMSITIAAFLLIATMPDRPTEFGIVWRVAMCAFGFGLFMAPNSRLLIGRAPRNRAAAAGGLLSTTRFGGSALAAAVVGVLLAYGVGFGPMPALVGCGFAVVAALCCLVRFQTARAARGPDTPAR